MPTPINSLRFRVVKTKTLGQASQPFAYSAQCSTDNLTWAPCGIAQDLESDAIADAERIKSLTDGMPAQGSVAWESEK